MNIQNKSFEKIDMVLSSYYNKDKNIVISFELKLKSDKELVDTWITYRFDSDQEIKLQYDVLGIKEYFDMLSDGSYVNYINKAINKSDELKKDSIVEDVIEDMNSTNDCIDFVLDDRKDIYLL